MGTKSKASDASIAQAAPFARPILRRIRRTVHAGCPGVEEVVKGGLPHVESRNWKYERS